MTKEAVLHIPMSQYAHGISASCIVIRIRVAKDDIKQCVLNVGDTACRKNPIDFYEVEMKKVASDLYFDYYEACFDSKYKRIYYFFTLDDGNESYYYFSDFFRKDLPEDRSEYYKLPFNHRADLSLIPDWTKDAIIYNIFPDSFASSREKITGIGLCKSFKGEKTTSKLGGTINGISQNVEYIKDLGFNCVYINPIFAAGEYHKYDTLDYFTIDPCFGTNDDFKRMVKIFHDNDIKVIIDGVFNHVGWKFYAFEDVVKNGEKSIYKDWFYGLEFPVIRPQDPDEYPNYECFAYERLMPKLNTENNEVQELLLKVARFWIKEFDIDGWRLDVASEVNDNFWREFRKAVKQEKPEAFIIGEVWESAGHWMQGDMFDSTMNYDLRKFCSYFFAKEEIDAQTFNAGLTSMLLRYKKDLTYGALNLLDSHDVSRFLSVCDGNISKYKLAVVFQMMFIGIPSVFYGDEQGFEGIIEDEYRKPMKFDATGEIYEFFKKIIDIRKTQIAVRRGEYQTLTAKDRLLIFKRTYMDDNVFVILNADNKSVQVELQDKNILYAENANANKINEYGWIIYK